VTLVKKATPRANRRPSTTPRDGAGGTLLGIFIGLALGLALASGVAWTLIGGRVTAPAKAPEPPSATRDPRAPKAATAAAAPAPADKDRFDFYKILPGGEEPKIAKSGDRASPDKATAGRAEPAKPADKVAAAEPSPTKGAKPGDRFWLQAGSFAQESEAENLKARLALAGWEAEVQPGTLPDKGVRYRVRLGPYDNADELNRIKGQLTQRGFEAAVIKF